MKKRSVYIAGGLALATAIGWALYPQDRAASEDIGALQAIVQIPIPATSIKWEIYQVPDDDGWFALGPVDHVQLVAELVPGDGSWFARQPDDGGELSIGPDAARAWLSPPFRALLKDTTTDRRRRCKPHQTTVTKSGRAVKGVVCEHQGSLPLYPMLSD